LNISEVRVRKVEGKDKFKAWATVTFDNALRLHGFKVIEGKDGPFVAMPSRKLPSGKFIDIAYPLNQELRGMIQEKILEEYNRQEGP